MFYGLIGKFLETASDEVLLELIDTYNSVSFVKDHPDQIFLVLNEFRNRLKARNTESSRLQEEITKLENGDEISALRSEIERLEEELVHSEREISSLEDEVSRLEDELGDR